MRTHPRRHPAPPGEERLGNWPILEHGVPAVRADGRAEVLAGPAARFGRLARALQAAGDMKRVETIISPSELEDVKDALEGIGAWISGLTAGEVKGFAQRRDARYRGGDHTIDFVPQVRIEVVVPDPLVPRVVHELERTLRSHEAGGGRIFVIPVDEVVRVRTGERGEDAL